MSINPKDIIINTAYIDYQLIRDYSTWLDFYNSCPLLQDLGEDVKTYSKTYRVYEDSNGLLFSNGIFYDKVNDILHTQTAVYKQWYSKLLLGYKVNRWMPKDYYADKMYWFTIDDGDTDSFKIIRNNSILLRGFINAGDLTIFTSKEMINTTKNVVVVKNADTYVTQKVEYVQPHESWYSCIKLDKFTPYDRTNLYADFSTEMWAVTNRMGLDITSIANMGAGVLYSAYGADINSVIPNFLNLKTVAYTSTFHINSMTVRSDDTSDIVYHGYLGWEFLYNYRWASYKQTLSVLNQWISETHGTSPDLIKYIVPQIRFVNGVALSSSDAHLGVARIDSPMVDRTTYQLASMIDANKNGDVVTLVSLYSGTLTSTDITLSTFKTTFFTLFPDLSSDSISTLIDDITDFKELMTVDGKWIPIILLDSANFTTYSPSSKISSVYLMTLYIWKIISPFLSLTDWTDATGGAHSFYSVSVFESNLRSLDISSYINIANPARYNTYTSKMLAINARWNVYPMMTQFFNPSIYDMLSGTSTSIKTYTASGGFRETIDESTFASAQADCKIEFNESTVDNTLFFMSLAVDNLEYSMFHTDDITSLQYSVTGPQWIFLVEREDTGLDSLNNIKLQFKNDNTRLMTVPIDVENANTAMIPYRGLLLLDDVFEGENFNLNKLWINRDLTSNIWMCKFNLLKYDKADMDRAITFRFYGSHDVRAIQKLAYEFGLGFELVASDNVDNLEMLRIIYLITDNANSANNIFVEKLMADPNKLKLIFRKLTSANISLRTVVGCKDDESIINQTDYII